LAILHGDDEGWYQVWQRKGSLASAKPSHDLADLFAADGFDGAMAQTTGPALVHIRDLITSSLGIQPRTRVLEVGCGAGAVLSLLEDTRASLAGADFSAPHISIARQFLPGADLRVAEAAELPWSDAAFDAVFSYGVFLYFPDLAYAESVLREMLRMAQPGGPILILDIPDAAKREDCESARRTAGAALNPPHCYYLKSFFEQFACARGLPVRTFDQQVPGYANSAFRFNALIGAL
jgi:SAM-dependent methyltransferase